MKKINVIIIAFAMCMGFYSCGESGEIKDSESESSAEIITEQITTEEITEYNHDWAEATCQTPKTCKICNETDGETTDHSTHRGKCTSCGEYILDEAFIPDFKDFTACVGLSEVPSEFTLSSTDSTDTGFDTYFSIPDNKRIESCQNLGWDILISYTGTSDFNIINGYSMNYVPTNQNELDELYNAIYSEYEKNLGSPTENKWKDSTGGTE